MPNQIMSLSLRYICIVWDLDIEIYARNYKKKYQHEGNILLNTMSKMLFLNIMILLKPQNYRILVKKSKLC